MTYSTNLSYFGNRKSSFSVTIAKNTNVIKCEYPSTSGTVFLWRKLYQFSMFFVLVSMCFFFFKGYPIGGYTVSFNYSRWSENDEKNIFNQIELFISFNAATNSCLQCSDLSDGTDFSNDFVRQMEITSKVYFVLMAYLLFYCSKLSDNNLGDMYSARRC